jgi:hypothetical protein
MVGLQPGNLLESVAAQAGRQGLFLVCDGEADFPDE